MRLIQLFFSFSSNSYDLSELSGKKYDVGQDTNTYSFGICTSPKEPCRENAGACRTTQGQSSSMGVINNVLQLPDATSAPFLLYGSGSVCKGLDQKWTTKIEFICQTDGMAAGPKIVEDTNCTLIIHFATKLVCRNDVNVETTIHLCFIINVQLIHLSLIFLLFLLHKMKIDKMQNIRLHCKS